VVQPAAVVLLHGAEPGALQELLGPQGHVRGAGGGVLELDEEGQWQTVDSGSKRGEFRFQSNSIQTFKACS